jgi:hypothetical protein
LSLEDAARLASVQEDYQGLLDAIWSAEAAKDPLVSSFQADLDGQIASLRKQVLDLRLLAQNGMLLDPARDRDEAHVRSSLASSMNWYVHGDSDHGVSIQCDACCFMSSGAQVASSVDAAIVQAYAKNLLLQVQDLKVEANKLLGFQRLFQFPEAELVELEDTLFEVDMKETLWRSLSSLAEQCSAWQSEGFFEVSVSTFSAMRSLWMPLSLSLRTDCTPYPQHVCISCHSICCNRLTPALVCRWTLRHWV